MDEIELETSDRSIVIIVFDPEDESIVIEPGDMYWHETLGLLMGALDQWRSMECEDEEEVE